MGHLRILPTLLAALLILAPNPQPARSFQPFEPLPPLLPGEVRFAVAADMRSFTTAPADFPGAASALAGLGPTQFMITPGDMEPPAQMRAALDAALGSSYPWYPVIGNHELPGLGQESTLGANLAWLRAWPAAYGASLKRQGPAPCPETTYSFDIPPVHFAAINEYCDVGGDAVLYGDVPDLIYNWLAQDLAESTQPYKFVIGHEPAFPQPDADLGGAGRHVGDSLDQYPTHRDRFWALLVQHKVIAYLTGHTHLYSAIKKDGVWQIDAGHARGAGDLSAPSTFLVITVSEKSATMRVYRGIPAYPLKHVLVLNGRSTFLPIITR